MPQVAVATALSQGNPRPRLALVSDPPPPSVATGALIDGRYRIVGPLAQGGMGIVYRAEDEMLQRPAAIKVIEPKLAQSKASVEQFRREARALARLRHDNVVQIYAFGSTGASHFFAMEYVDGENLDVILERSRADDTWLTLDRVLEILQKVASGLTAAHGRHVTHRDVKPANIVIERETGRPVLLDFGIARLAADTEGRDAAGTPAYMAPEQIRNDSDVMGDRIDVYALACTAFELICGRLPFDGEAAYELMHGHLERPPRLMSSLRPEYAAFDPVFSRALAKDARYRHESCVDFVEELAQATRFLARPSRVSRVSRPDRGDIDIDVDVDIEAQVETLGPAPEALSTVLILAEDDVLRRSLVRAATQALQSAGQENPTVECVATKRELIITAQLRRPSLVVIDDDCARSASLAIAHRLRALPGGGAMHVVVLTRDMLAERGVWQAVGAQRVSKPFSPRALAATLDDLLRPKV